jgi:glucose-6-phosphate 1-dehydrogenase
MERRDSDRLVIFGATGDLCYKKIYPALYSLVRRGLLTVPVIGVARAGWNNDQYVAHVRKSVAEHVKQPEAAVVEKLAALLRYVDGDYGKSATFDALFKALDNSQRPLFYLAIPPSVFPVVIGHLSKQRPAGARVVVEKPFGRDLASAQALNRTLLQEFPESSIFRIDHYLGKEAVQNLLYFRFANSFLEPIWNRNFVASVQVTMAEKIGVAGRGKFYEEAGAIRDVIQNHLMQIVAFLAMEPPVNTEGESLRDEKVKVLKSIRPMTQKNLCRGQFRGYRQEPGVAPDSKVETFAAANACPSRRRKSSSICARRRLRSLVTWDRRSRITCAFVSGPMSLSLWARMRRRPDLPCTGATWSCSLRRSRPERWTPTSCSSAAR